MKLSVEAIVQSVVESPSVDVADVQCLDLSLGYEQPFGGGQLLSKTREWRSEQDMEPVHSRFAEKQRPYSGLSVAIGFLDH